MRKRAARKTGARRDDRRIAARPPATARCAARQRARFVAAARELITSVPIRDAAPQRRPAPPLLLSAENASFRRANWRKPAGLEGDTRGRLAFSRFVEVCAPFSQGCLRVVRAPRGACRPRPAQVRAESQRPRRSPRARARRRLRPATHRHGAAGHRLRRRQAGDARRFRPSQVPPPDQSPATPSHAATQAPSPRSLRPPRLAGALHESTPRTSRGDEHRADTVARLRPRRSSDSTRRTTVERPRSPPPAPRRRAASRERHDHRRRPSAAHHRRDGRADATPTPTSATASQATDHRRDARQPATAHASQRLGRPLADHGDRQVRRVTDPDRRPRSQPTLDPSPARSARSSTRSPARSRPILNPVTGTVRRRSSTRSPARVRRSSTRSPAPSVQILNPVTGTVRPADPRPASPARVAPVAGPVTGTVIAGGRPRPAARPSAVRPARSRHRGRRSGRRRPVHRSRARHRRIAVRRDARRRAGHRRSRSRLHSRSARCAASAGASIRPRRRGLSDRHRGIRSPRCSRSLCPTAHAAGLAGLRGSRGRRRRFRRRGMAALLALFLLAVIVTATRLVTVPAFVRPAPLVLLPDPPG